VKDSEEEEDYYSDEPKSSSKSKYDPVAEETARRRSQLMRELQKRCNVIPDEFKTTPFNPLPSVVRILQSNGELAIILGFY
jgi:hypothetical protein